jgi:Phage integrase family
VTIRTLCAASPQFSHKARLNFSTSGWSLPFEPARVPPQTGPGSSGRSSCNRSKRRTDQSRCSLQRTEVRSFTHCGVAGTVLEELRAHRLRQAQELLRLGTRLSDETFVCAREDGLPLQPDSFTHDWDRKIATTYLPRLRFHDLRHAHATHLLAAGIHPKVASERLGHSKIGITLDLYSHVLPNMQADAAAIVDGALRAALNKKGNKRLEKG